MNVVVISILVRAGLRTVLGKLDVGNATIQKTSANTSITKDNNCYSLAGATYGIYSNKDCIDLVTSLTTDKNGNTDIEYSAI